jgi:hypothetical protein
VATVVGVLDLDHWGSNTDNIVVADPTTRTLTWIPRDLWCPSIKNRINKAFAFGGIERLIAALNELGFPCDQGLVLRRGATERAAMRISLEVPVEEPLDYWYPLHPDDARPGRAKTRHLSASARAARGRTHSSMARRPQGGRSAAHAQVRQ